MQVMPLLLLQFAGQYEAVQTRLSFTDRIVDIVDEGIDLSVRIGSAESRPADVGQQVLGNERLVFGASPGYVARKGCPRSIDDLSLRERVTQGASTVRQAVARAGRCSARQTAHDGQQAGRRPRRGAT
jgi:DNA-binding transcriptional LysR family regulator